MNRKRLCFVSLAAAFYAAFLYYLMAGHQVHFLEFFVLFASLHIGFAATVYLTVKGKSVTRIQRLNMILITLGIACPFLLFLEYYLAFTGPEILGVVLACAGPVVGTAAAGAYLIINRKSLGIFAWLFLLFLFLLNILASPPVFLMIEHCWGTSLNRLGWQGRYDGGEKIYCRFTEKTAEQLVSLTQGGRPVSLEFKMCDITDDVVAILSGNPYVKSLSIIDCPNITDGVVERISHIPRLKTVDLSDNPQLKKADFSKLADLTKLKTLRLRGDFNLSEESLESIRRLRHLEVIEMNFKDSAEPERPAKTSGEGQTAVQRKEAR